MTLSLTIHPEFAKAYRKYAGYQSGESFRLYVRTGGPGTGGLYYAIERDMAESEDAVYEVDGIIFFVRPADFWYFDGAELSYDNLLGEFGFTYQNPNIAV
ncbi:iron-sulfur cluster biosynthesis family protein [Brevibacillus dissolubilis]|uniref:iron-sulfur cluster biosynthesis family protein n=1 Tax=Brevibacillus dissolubilis TaxID=1844116 RepID=UPI001117A7C1|nr:iron-sulfur cluster biosynthesis family protein [Brevibacillus dissolubilis]